jgi:hypothetical protein
MKAAPLSAAILVRGLRSREAVDERVVRTAAAVDAAAPRSGLKQMVDAATDLLTATRAQRGSE